MGSAKSGPHRHSFLVPRWVGSLSTSVISLGRSVIPAILLGMWLPIALPGRRTWMHPHPLGVDFDVDIKEERLKSLALVMAAVGRVFETWAKKDLIGVGLSG